MLNDPILKFYKLLSLLPGQTDPMHKASYWRQQKIWANEQRGKNGFKTRFDLYQHLKDKHLTEEDIIYLEFGVYKGESIKYWSEIVKTSAARFYGFDTFTGLPEFWVDERPKGHFSTQGKLPQIDDSRVNFIAGLFQQTLPGFMEKHNQELSAKIKVIHLDADLYSSSLYVMMMLCSKLKPGDILVFDEFTYPAWDEFRAYIDFCKAAYIETSFVGEAAGFEQVAFKIESIPGSSIK